MVVLVTGAALLAQMMRGDRRREPDSSWLLYGPTDADAVEDDDRDWEPPALLMAAE